MADDFKAKGNAAFSAGKFEEAIEHFTEGIAVAPDNHVLYSNRSAAKASLQDYEGALEDAEQVVKLKADWPKGYSRLGSALQGLQRWDDAIDAYRRGLEVDSSNAQLQEGLSQSEAGKERSEKAGGGAGGIFGPEFMAKLAMNPKTRAYLSQPDFQAMMRDMGTNPGNMNRYLADERFQNALQVGLGLNIQTGDQFAEDQQQAANSAAPQPPTENGGAAAAPMERDAPKPSAPEPQAAPQPASEPESEEEKANAKRKADALAEKEQGNAAYKKKDFQSAVQHYDRALELYEGDISFLTNRAAVYLEMGEYDKVIADCDTAVERGRELRADYKMIARALTRKGNALVKKGDLPAAIDTFHKSLTEHRNADTLAKLQAAEKQLKAEQEASYVDMDKSNAEKEAGNTAFKEQKYPEAVQHYTEALKRGPPGVNPEAHKLFSNRAACYTKLGAWNEGLKDAKECIALEPSFIKGYSRKGHLEFFMKDYDAALETYEAGLKQDPNSEELKEGIRRTIAAMNAAAGGEGMTEEERKLKQQKAMADPEIQNILTDPIMRQVLDDFQNDPAAAQRHLKAPEIMAKLQKLVKAGIVKMA